MSFRAKAPGTQGACETRSASQTMNDTTKVFFEDLLQQYSLRNTGAVYDAIGKLTQRPDFPELFERLTGEKTSPSQTCDPVDVLQKLVDRMEARNAKKRKHNAALESYYGIAETLKDKCGPEVSAIYLETTYPNELVEEARRQLDSDDASAVPQVLPGNAVDKYKNELIRVEKGRRTLIHMLERQSNFPLRNAHALMRALSRLHQGLRSNYRYLSLKPEFVRLVSVGDYPNANFETVARSLNEGAYPMLDRYRATGEEPTLLAQLELRFAIDRLCARIKTSDAIADSDLRDFQDELTEIWSYKGESSLGVYGHGILVETLKQVNRDLQALSKTLAKTLIDEYRDAEHRMTVIHDHIVKQLAYTSEFLKRFDPEAPELSDADRAKARIAQNKLIGLDGIFDLTVEAERARSCPPMELERVALGVPSNVESRQIVEWLRIYGVIFANSDFLRYAQQSIDFSTMRALISRLSTYHLIQNVAFLRHVVEQGLTLSEEEKTKRFKQINRLLKLRLQGLMGGTRMSDKSISEMIEELGFIDNKQVQFLIAETLKGFASLATAFEQTTQDYFVRDREALLKESRELYDEVCSQCLKNFVHIKPKPVASSTRTKTAPWYRRLFS